MGPGLTRNEFFGIVLPGAIVLFLTDVLLRILGSIDGASSDFGRAVDVIEHPFVGLAAAFAIGLVLHFLDLPTFTPEFYIDLPGDKLYELMKSSGKQRLAVSTYYLALVDLMPPNLADRVLFFGSLYRVGVLTVLFSVSSGAVLPALLVLQNQNPALAPIQWTRYDVLCCILLVLIFVVGPIARLFLPTRSGRGAQESLAPPAVVITCVLTVVGVAGMWVHVLVSEGFGSKATENWILLISFAVVGIWFALRLLGPLDVRVRYWVARFTGRSPRRPAIPFTRQSTRMIDAMPAALGLGGLIVTAGEHGSAPTLGAAAILTAGLSVARVQRHVTRLQGIYRNQVQWVEKNFEQIINDLVP